MCFFVSVGIKTTLALECVNWYVCRSLLHFHFVMVKSSHESFKYARCVSIVNVCECVCLCVMPNQRKCNYNQSELDVRMMSAGNVNIQTLN